MSTDEAFGFFLFCVIVLIGLIAYQVGATTRDRYRSACVMTQGCPQVFEALGSPPK